MFPFDCTPVYRQKLCLFPFDCTPVYRQKLCVFPFDCTPVYRQKLCLFPFDCTPVYRQKLCLFPFDCTPVYRQKLCLFSPLPQKKKKEQFYDVLLGKLEMSVLPKLKSHNIMTVMCSWQAHLIFFFTYLFFTNLSSQNKFQ